MRLAQGGADIAIVDIDADQGEETARLVEGLGRRAIFIRADVSEEEEVRAYIGAAEARLGPMTAFVNNAGIEGVIAPIFDYPVKVFDKLLAVNTRGVFLGLKYALAQMRGHGRGAVVNIASTSSIRGRAGLAGYVAAKHAVLGLTRVAALDMAGTGIRVNALLPGPIDTRMIHALDEQAREAGKPVQRTGRSDYGSPEDVAHVAAFLLSDNARHVNGAAWTVDAASTVP
jgi:NAD(P)-dependent dehydrogenase (short-subunit alcohol dehydrogenase family)